MKYLCVRAVNKWLENLTNFVRDKQSTLTCLSSRSRDISFHSTFHYQLKNSLIPKTDKVFRLAQ